MPKISVLTPLYNTEPDQLKEMIESVLAQSFSDFEFLLLNDSPDNTELESLVNGICQDTSKKLVRSLFIPEEPQQGLCPYASLPQDIFLT